MANYCTWDPNNRQAPNGNTIGLSNGNLQAVGTGSNFSIKSTLAFQGKQYIEVKMLDNSNPAGSRQAVGIIEYNVNIESGGTPLSNSTFSGIVFPALQPYSDGSAGSTGANLTDGQTICLAFSEEDQKWWYRVNDGSWVGGGDPTVSSSTPSGTFTSGKTYLWINHLYGTDDKNITDFGGSGYAYTPPEGYNTVSSDKLSEAAVTDPSLYFKPIAYEGNGEGQRVGNFIPFTDSKTVADSARFDDGGPDYLERTFASGGDVKTWTFSCWIKRTALGATNGEMRIFGGPSQASHIYLTSDDKIYWDVAVTGTGASTAFYRRTTREFQNTSRWFNLVCAYDTDQGTASDRMRIYIDGAEITEGTSSYPGSAYADNAINTAGVHSIGRRLASQGTAGMDLDCYMAEVVFIDAAQLTPSSFGQTDTSTNRWIPKDVSGLTFGTTGFYLNMTDGNDFGDDESGNTNDWTESGFDTTNGSNQMYDTPTRGFPTFSPSSVFSSDITLQEGNTRVRLTSANADCCSIVVAPIPSTGVYYWEFLALNTGSMYFGMSYNVNTLSASAFNQGWFIGMNGSRYDPSTGSGTALFSALSAGDMIGMAYNGDLGALYYSINGSWMDAAGSLGNSATVKAEIEAGTVTTNAIFNGVVQPALIGTNNINAQSILMPAVLDTSYGAMATLGAYANMGAWRYLDSGALTYSSTADGYFQSTTIPTNAKSLNQDNLETTTAGITGFSWIKNRDAADNHILQNRVSGIQEYIESNTTDQEETDVNSVQRFLQQGVQIGSMDAVNTASESFVLYPWAANTAPATVTDGMVLTSGGATSDIPRTANTAGGMSLIGYTGTGAYSTIKHGLSATPQFFIIKQTNATAAWKVWHHAYADPLQSYTTLESDAAETDPGNDTLWGGVPATSTTIGVGTQIDVNDSGDTYRGFIFAPVEGYSKFGSYTGNGNADGPFVYCGFRPAWILEKRMNSTGSWFMMDVARNAINPVTKYFTANSSAAEATATASSGQFINIYANGYRVSGTSSSPAYNIDNGTYLFAAFAEFPFAGSNIAQGKAR
mgnify:CR=1 FL=1